MGQKTLNENLWKPLAGLVGSAVLLTVIHAPFDVSLLAWVAWVPFILACRETLPLKILLPLAYGVGLAYWAGNLYWLQIVTLSGYITFSLSQALYWPVLALCVRFVRHKQWPLFLAAPVIFVGAEAWQGILYTGFQWYYLAHSQYENLPLIQICDIFGTLGLSVLIATAGGLIAQTLLKQRPLLTRWRLEWVVLAGLLAATILYGRHRLEETPQYQSESPLIGSVQPNVPSHVKEEIENGRKILNDLIADSRQCVAAGAKLVAWPETMVLAPINEQYRLYCREDSDPVIFDQLIADYCQSQQTTVLVGSQAAIIGIRDGRYTITDQYNSAFIYRPDGTADSKRYDKIHLVPFGEYIPFKNSAPWIYRMILFLSPYDYDYNLTQGTNYSTFELPVGQDTYHFGVLICYEDTDPSVTRKIVVDKNGNKSCDWLVNISNDGWYVFYNDGRMTPTVELAQRTAISVFRCVENRISIIRSVNTGISCVIEPTGAIRDGFTSGNLPEKTMQRQAVAGWFVDTVPIDSRVTLFSRFGRWLDGLLATALSVCLMLAVRQEWRKRRQQQNKPAPTS